MPAARAARAMLPVSTRAARKTRCLAGVQCARTRGGVCWVIRQDEADGARVGQRWRRVLDGFAVGCGAGASVKSYSLPASMPGPTARLARTFDLEPRACGGLDPRMETGVTSLYRRGPNSVNVTF